MNHSANIQRAFATQAAGFSNPGFTLARTDYLEWMLAHLPRQPGCRVLDVAAGSGHLTRAIAPGVGRIVALDLTIEMLRELRRHSVAGETSNLSAVQGLAETLPIRDAVFDLVVSRFAFHHFERPAVALQEMVRTCKRGGTVGIIDLVAPEEPRLAALYNGYERKRDDSHARALSEAELGDLLRNAGLVADSSAWRDVEVDLEAWLDLPKTAATAAQQIRTDLLAELDGGARTGMRPLVRDAKLVFLQRWVIAVARTAA